MKQVYDNLYIGDVNDADNPKQHRKKDIDYILNVSGSGPERKTAPSHETVKNKEYIHIPLADSGDNTDFLVKQAISTGRALHRQAIEGDKSLLVHCAVGASRSVAVAAALMSLENNRNVRENVSRIKKLVSMANPHDDLLGQVNRLTAELYEELQNTD